MVIAHSKRQNNPNITDECCELAKKVYKDITAVEWLFTNYCENDLDVVK